MNSDTIKKHKNLIPLIILFAVLINTTFVRLGSANLDLEESLTYAQIFPAKNLFAFCSLIICFASYFFFREHFKNVVLVTIFLGIAGIISYTVANYVVVFIVPFQPLSAGIALLYWALNYKRASRKILPEKEETQITIDEKLVEKFKSNYFSLSDQKLAEISKDNRFTEEAKIAANELLRQREDV